MISGYFYLNTKTYFVKVQQIKIGLKKKDENSQNQPHSLLLFYSLFCHPHIFTFIIP